VTRAGEALVDGAPEPLEPAGELADIGAGEPALTDGVEDVVTRFAGPLDPHALTAINAAQMPTAPALRARVLAVSTGFSLTATASPAGHQHGS
jgi:hypothetical protein